MSVKSVGGTHDILPGAVERWQGIEVAARRRFELYGFAEIRTPAFEETELFARSIGQETDIVQKQMYTFAQSKGKSITLRPEGTASVLRAYIQHALYRDGGLHKLYYIGPMFRHERPQKGRYRQFHQIGAEVLGSDHPAVEAEVIEMLHGLLAELGLTDHQLIVNSVGCQQCRPAYIDHLRSQLRKLSGRLCPECQRRSETNPLRVLDCKNCSCQPLIEGLPSLLDHVCTDCRQHFDQFQKYLDLQAIPHQISPRLVRGLDYYVRTTFEMISEGLGAGQNALVGGGRYDGLSEMLGGPPTQGFGFAMGLERLVLLLGALEKTAEPPAPDLFLVYLDDRSFDYVFQLARRLRQRGIFAYLEYQRRSLRAQMRRANRMNSRYVCVVGEEEMSGGKLGIKRMADGHQAEVLAEDLEAWMKGDPSVGTKKAAPK